MMERKKCNELGNAELKIYINTLMDEFEVKKSQIAELCEEMKEIQAAYEDAKREVEIRKNYYL